MPSIREYPTRSRFVAVVVSGFPKHPPFARVPISTTALWFPGVVTCSRLVCFSGLPPAFPPFTAYPSALGVSFTRKLRGWAGSFLIQINANQDIWQGSAARDKYTSFLTWRQQDCEQQGSTFSRADTHSPWYSQTSEKPLHLTETAFEKVSISFQLPSQVHRAWRSILVPIQGDVKECGVSGPLSRFSPLSWIRISKSRDVSLTCQRWWGVPSWCIFSPWLLLLLFSVLGSRDGFTFSWFLFKVTALNQLLWKIFCMEKKMLNRNWNQREIINQMVKRKALIILLSSK